MKFFLLSVTTAVLAGIGAEKIVYTPSPNAFSVKFFKTHDGSCTLITAPRSVQDYSLVEGERFKIIEIGAVVENGHLFHPFKPFMSENQIVEILAVTEAELQHALDSQCISYEHEGSNHNEFGPFANVTSIVKNGDPKNRIDVVLMGDGYQADQYTQFIEDMTRLTQEMFVGITFKSYLPLFNVWAVFVPSKASGIGVGGQPKDTAFGLYRDGTELRGIYCSKPTAARQACKLTGPYACDFPSLIANDDFYGGLGGEFTISTKSKHTGTIVLRHEMGHNFGRVGEEYDGGQVYSGANSARSLESLGWKHWLTEQRPVIEKNTLLLQDYPWVDLATRPYVKTFESDGNNESFELILSVSGFETPGSLRVSVDGHELPWTTNGLRDRSFYTWKGSAFSKGRHTLRIEQLKPSETGQIRQLCNLGLHEFHSSYRSDSSFIGAYPTINYRGGMTLRPTHETCLMRNMTSPIFCKVCQENMWHQHLSKMSLIDSVSVTDSGIVNLAVVPLAHLRAEAIPGESYSVKWFQNGSQRFDLNDKYMWNSVPESDSGSWRVQLIFSTPEVRKDPRGLLSKSLNFRI